MPDDATNAKSSAIWQLDPAGAFHIGIAKGNDGKRYIVAEHAQETIIGENAAEILNMIIDKGLVTRLEHAGYLGRELEKAEIAIEFDRSYVQDDDF
jgi:dihydropteroate synthase